MRLLTPEQTEILNATLKKHKEDWQKQILKMELEMSGPKVPISSMYLLNTSPQSYITKNTNGGPKLMSSWEIVLQNIIFPHGYTRKDVVKVWKSHLKDDSRLMIQFDDGQYGVTIPWYEQMRVLETLDRAAMEWMGWKQAIDAEPVWEKKSLPPDVVKDSEAYRRFIRSPIQIDGQEMPIKLLKESYPYITTSTNRLFGIGVDPAQDTGPKCCHDEVMLTVEADMNSSVHEYVNRGLLDDWEETVKAAVELKKQEALQQFKRTAKSWPKCKLHGHVAGLEWERDGAEATAYLTCQGNDDENHR